jgi:hypothetical protein
MAHLLRPQTDPPQKLGRTLSPFLAPRDLMHQQRLAHDGAYRDAGVERRVRVLEDDLHLAAIRQHPRRRQAGDVVAGELDRARGRLQQPQHRLAEGGFSGTALADQAQGFAVADRERDVVDGKDVAPGARDDAAADREVLLQSRNLQQRRSGCRMDGGW